LAIADLPPADTSLGSIAKIIFSDLSGQLKSEYLSNQNGRLWLDNSPTLMLKISLILHAAIESVNSDAIPERIGERTLETAAEATIALKSKTFSTLNIRF
jgi:hypothetical protein